MSEMVESAEWFDIASAPAGAWVRTRYASGHLGVHIKHTEPGWWEDETGDWTIEAMQNNGHGITHWAYLPPDYVISDFEGTARYGEPKATPSPRS